MSEQSQSSAPEPSDSRVDAISTVILIAVVVTAAIFWVSGQ